MKSLEKKSKEINEGLENISKTVTEAILPYFEEKSIIEEEKEEQPRSKWEELLEIIFIEVQENKKGTNQRLMNLERNTDLLEQGLASLVAQVVTNWNSKESLKGGNGSRSGVEAEALLCRNLTLEWEQIYVNL
ncbi:hypothetical protein SASPL_146174 [Salvia splendens]|uniref:Uncharacterized protein n=1 Tax=Salvia splendens TaxID=180675 RepID=A0A8X8WK66_SALSN|nr:hypothetical protein SASPL_146174 [Salvia splendens]